MKYCEDCGKEIIFEAEVDSGETFDVDKHCNCFILLSEDDFQEIE
jgi:hypothetical protein